MYVLTARIHRDFQQGQISLSDPQRSWASISLQDIVNVRKYDPFSQGNQPYLGSVDAEISFAGRKTTTEQLDQDDMAAVFIRVCCSLNRCISVLISTEL